MNDKPGIYRQSFEFETHFTQIPNRWLRDPNLSMKAKGLLVYLMSHEIGYHISLGQIERETNDGKSAIRSAIQELEVAGYLKTARTKDARGYNAGLSYVLQEPKSENPTLENPTLENRTAYREQNLTREQNFIENISSNEFEEFWNLYPRKVGKGDAKKAYVKAVGEFGSAQVMAGARRFASDPNLPEPKYIPHPATWLNRGGWDDDPYPATQSKAQAKEQRQEQAAKRFLEAFDQPTKQLESNIDWNVL